MAVKLFAFFVVFVVIYILAKSFKLGSRRSLLMFDSISTK